ncbi:MAG: GDP-mannose 4,6-dehydratase [Candidatus Rokuibacteriota bacterium]
MRVLVTGLTGFVGGHFAELAMKQGAEVHGSHRPGTGTRGDHVDVLDSRVHLVECDLRDAGSVGRLLEASRPDAVLHLAAQSSVAASWRSPADTLQTNVIAQVNLLEAVRAAGMTPRILIAGSADEYGWAEPHELPLGETAPLRPLSPYAVSKVAQDLMGYQYFKSFGLPILRTRAFPHEGPRRSPDYATASLARQVAEIEAGRRPPVIDVGNLEARRDYTDVRDVVRAYWLLLADGQPGEAYNVCSGRAWRMRDVLGFLLDEARVRPIQVREDPDRLRPSDAPALVGDGTKIATAVGWRPEIPFEQTLRDVLDYWRERVPRTSSEP